MWHSPRWFVSLVPCIWGLYLCWTVSARADPPAAVPAPTFEVEGSGIDPDYNGLDFTRPETSLSTRFEYRTSSGPSGQTTQAIPLMQGTAKFNLSADWKLGLLAQFPFVSRTTTSFDPLTTSNLSGAGDTILQGALVNQIDPRWAYGVGARLVAPTGEGPLGTGKWQIMPGAAIRYTFIEHGPETYFVPVVRYAISFDGDPARRRISEFQIAPTFNIGLPDRFFVTLYPSNDVRINYGGKVPGQTGRLFLPFDFLAGRKLSDTVVLSLEASLPVIKSYPVYDFKTELRLQALF